MRKVLLAAAFVGVLAFNASATHVIDSFSAGSVNKSAASGTITDSQTGLADVIGIGGTSPGQRDILCTIGDAPIHLEVQVVVVSGKAALATPPMAHATIGFSYGSFTSLGQLNADFSMDGGLMFEVDFADQNGQAVIALKSEDKVYTCPAILIPRNNGRDGVAVFLAPFTAFPGLTESGDLANIDGIRYTLSSNNPAWDVVISQLATTHAHPEPATLSLLGLGVLALLRRRRRVLGNAKGRFPGVCC